jgi:hypothetical protein
VFVSGLAGGGVMRRAVGRRHKDGDKRQNSDFHDDKP